MLLFLFENNKVLSYPDIQLSGKNIPGLSLLDQSCNVMQILLVINFISRNLYSYLKLQLQLFALVNVLTSFWLTRNNNELTKCIILLLPRQNSKKFFRICVNAFTPKKYV